MIGFDTNLWLSIHFQFKFHQNKNQHITTTRDIFDGALSDLSCHRELENIAGAARAAISRPRKLAALLLPNRRRIRIYDMEVEDDDDDDTLETSGAANVSD